MVNIGVVGAGVIGLSSAINIQKLIPDAKVTIIADKFDKDTTSSGAGGLFRPYLDHFKDQDLNLVKEWVTASWEFYHSLATSEEAAESGQTLVTGTVVYNTPQDDQYSLLKELVCDFHQVSEDYLKRLKLWDKYKYAYTYTTVITESNRYIVWLMKKFCEAGGVVQHRTVDQLTDLCGEFDVVVNCSGLGARQLVGDDDVHAVKGHLVQVHAPWVKHFFLSEDDVYFIPHSDKLHIGGVREKGNYDLTPDPATRHHILSRAQALFPQLKDVKVVGEWVGLRPARSVVRYDSEILDGGPRGKLLVVHNYGHGGHGITLSWGAGLGTARRVQDLLRGQRSRL